MGTNGGFTPPAPDDPWRPCKKKNKKLCWAAALEVFLVAGEPANPAKPRWNSLYGPGGANRNHGKKKTDREIRLSDIEEEIEYLLAAPNAPEAGRLRRERRGHHTLNVTSPGPGENLIHYRAGHALRGRAAREAETGPR